MASTTPNTTHSTAITPTDQTVADPLSDPAGMPDLCDAANLPAVPDGWNHLPRPPRQLSWGRPSAAGRPSPVILRSPPPSPPPEPPPRRSAPGSVRRDPGRSP